MMKRRWLAAVLVLLAGPVHARNPDQNLGRNLDQAVALFHDGAFREAADTAARVRTAPALALAARAALAYAAYKAPREERFDALARAEEMARAALAIDRQNVEALLQLSVALGYRSRSGYIRAHFAGRAREARQLIDRALALDPHEAWAHAALAAWHAELVVAGGRILAATFYHASAKKSVLHYRQAVAEAPANPVIHVEFAKALLRLKRRGYRALALAELKTAAALTPRDAFESIVQGQGAMLLAAMATRGNRALERVLREIDPFARSAKAPIGRPR